MAGKLTPLFVDRQVTPGKYADGDGLYFIVAGPTSRNWSYRYWFKGKERWHGLGSLQDVSLKEARIKRDTARQEVRAGVDIVEQKRSAREEAKAVAVTAALPTFEQCAQRYIDENWSRWSKKHRAQWPSSLAAYLEQNFSVLPQEFCGRSLALDLLKTMRLSLRKYARYGKYEGSRDDRGQA
jgi:hypothetical protein